MNGLENTKKENSYLSHLGVFSFSIALSIVLILPPLAQPAWSPSPISRHVIYLPGASPQRS